MEISPYKESALEPGLISKWSPLLTLVPLLLQSEEPPPLSPTYTPGLVSLCDNSGLSLYAEGLYWTIKEHHLIVATREASLFPTDDLPPSVGNFNFKGSLKRIVPSWDWGWRVGIDYTSPCDYWDMNIFWTSFSTNQGEMIPLVDLPAINQWAYPDVLEGGRLFRHRGNWKLNYSVLNAEFGRAFWIGCTLAFRPHFGLGGSWIDQSLHLYSEFQPAYGNFFGNVVQARSDFSGGGLRTGFDLYFTSGSGFGLYGKVALSLFYGTFDGSFRETETFPQLPSQLIGKSFDRFQMGVTAFQTALGGSWKKCLCSQRFLVGLYAQWELNQWNDMGRFPHFQGELQEGIFHQGGGTLTLMGLSFGGNFDF